MEPYVGQIQAFGFNFAPRGWAQCNGQLLAISQYQTLFSLLGTIYGGDGRTTFALPDLRSRSIVGIGQGPGQDNIKIGERGGSNSHTLVTGNLPAHNHAVSVGVNTETGEEATATGILSNHAGAFNEDVTSGAKLGGVNEINVGSGQAFNIRNPFLGMNVCIALDGLYPPRN